MDWIEFGVGREAAIDFGKNGEHIGGRYHFIRWLY